MEFEPDGQRKYPNSELLASSADRAWSTLSAELRSHPAGRVASTIQRNVEIVIAICGSNCGSVVRTTAGQQQHTPSSTGTIWLAPIGCGEEDIAITAPIPKTLHLYLPAQPFNMLAKQFNFARSPANCIHYLGGLKDELIRQIGLAVISEMDAETATGRMFAETSSLMLAARLASSYADGSFLKSGPINQHRLDKLRLRRVLDYIDQNLEGDITVAELASLANLSAFHFTRMFTAAIGVAPYRYVSRRRLEHAMVMLTDGKLPLHEIAHRSQFASQASFNRAFRRATGMSPGEYRRLLR